jgi:transcriptional regulator with XRE-family HTH domain
MPSARLREVLAHVAANVRRTRARRALTQEQLSEAAGVDITTEQRIERAALNITLDVLVRLADALAVPPGALLRPAALPPPKVGRPPKRRASRKPSAAKR